MHLSKSRFVAGLQCHRQLWWRVHEPKAPELEVDPELQAIFDQGHAVGAKAREHFPGGVLVDALHHDFAGRLEQTRRALDSGAPSIFEAAFTAGDVFVAVDVLERTPRGFTVVEVKSSTSVKDEHVPDAAIQAYVLRHAGLPVERVEVMHLNRECRFPDLSNLFIRQDVTDAAAALCAEAPHIVAAQLEALRGDLPDVATGDHCSSPRECPFLARCWPPGPDHHVRTLYYIGKRAAELEARGFVTIHDLPEDVKLSRIASRQRCAVRENRIIVEPGLRGALASISRPFAVLDFETVGLAIPAWNGCRPYDQVPAQFSCHLVRGHADPVHHAWIADSSDDPRPALAARLIEACRGAASVVAYNSSFEAKALRHLAEFVPSHAAELLNIEKRLIDALPIVRDHVYHPAFGGSFSLKSVLPALVPTMSYQDLDVAGGQLASVELARLMFEGHAMGHADRDRLRESLRSYCALDTLGVVRLLDRLDVLAARA